MVTQRGLEPCQPDQRQDHHRHSYLNLTQFNSIQQRQRGMDHN
jgi:hypothetical protein